MSRTKLLSLIISTLITFILLVFCFINFVVTSRQKGITDYGSFIASGRAALQGNNPYNPSNEYVLHVFDPFTNTQYDAINLNPPISVWIASLFAYPDPLVTFPIWRIISIILYVVTLILLIGFYPSKKVWLFSLWAISLPGFWQTLEFGQVYCVLTFFIVLGWILIEKKYFVLSGIAIGIAVALKPNLGVWILYLLIARYWKSSLTAALTFSIVSFIPFVLYGSGIYSEWFTATSNLPFLKGEFNSSLTGLFLQFDNPRTGLVLGFIIIPILGYWIFKNNLTSNAISSISIITSLIASPIAWLGYLIFMLPIFFSNKWNKLLLLSAAILVIPGNFIREFNIQFNGILFGWWYGFALVLLLLNFILPPIRSRWKANTQI